MCVCVCVWVCVCVCVCVYGGGGGRRGVPTAEVGKYVWSEGIRLHSWGKVRGKNPKRITETDL